MDHALVTSSLNPQVTDVTEWHINANEPRILDYNLEFIGAGQSPDFYTPTPYRSSDHDPVIVGMNLSSSITTTNGGNGNDTLNGASGRDQINGSNGDDSLSGGNGNDILNGGNGNDILLGQISNDNLIGGNGNALLYAGLGNDTLLGGRGIDRFMVAPSDGTDTISDFTRQDLICLPEGLSFGQLSITQGIGINANNTSIGVQNSGEILAILAGVQASTITSADFMPC